MNDENNNTIAIVSIPELREATSDRITLGVTAVLTLSAISLDSRSDLPKVRLHGSYHNLPQ